MAKARWRSCARFLMVLGISLGLIQCGEGPGRLTHKTYPEGFSLKHPADWEARVLDKGLILVSAKDAAKDPSFIAIYPIILKSAATSRSWSVGERDVPWIAVLLSIVATETSSVTFLSIPGVAW
ncbi:hypothetical protein D4R89_08075, partial [bacterium]